MQDMLSRIVADKRKEVAARSAAVPAEELRRRADDTEPPRNFFAAVTRPAGELRVIAEVKRASPSAGLIRELFDPVAISRGYAENGAAAISCLTDEPYFHGSLSYLSLIKAAVPLPVLRKDFIIDPYQVLESRAAGADAILLIAECLTEPLMLDLLILATELKLTTLIEVHDLESLVQVNSHVGFPHPTYQLLGINNRDLKTMTTDVSHTISLLPHVQDPAILVSESGIRTPQDIALLRSHGVHRMLVGEYLMRQPDPGKALRELMGG